MLLFSDVLYMLVRYATPSGPTCLSCLMLTLSGPCVVVSVMLVVCTLGVFLSMCLFVLCILCLFCVGELFAICVGEVNIFSLKVMVLCLGCVFFWLIHVLSSKEYVCCVCDPSMCLGVPSICQICVFV